MPGIFYRDGVRVDTAWYRSGNTFSYTLSKPGSYYVRAFARTPADIRSCGKKFCLFACGAAASAADYLCYGEQG